MKKLLFSILAFLGIGLSFCSAENVSDLIDFVTTGHINYVTPSNTAYFVNLADIGTDYGTYCIKLSNLTNQSGQLSQVSLGFADTTTKTPNNIYFLYFDQFGNTVCLYGNKAYLNVGNRVLSSTTSFGRLAFSADYEVFKLNTLLDESIITSCPTSSINVLYNNENSTTSITCNGDNVIQIDGLSTITATNKFTPYFNIDYKDENNQSLIESYSKNILYLSGSLFKKTYTGNNDRILTSQSNNNESSFSGYTPTFDVVFTGDTREDTGNVFNNFAQNSLQVALSNIPSYIQYVIIIMLLFFILGLARRKKRR